MLNYTTDNEEEEEKNTEHLQNVRLLYTFMLNINLLKGLPFQI